MGTLFAGPAAKALGGANVSPLIGLPVSGLLHRWFARSIDGEAELRLIEAGGGPETAAEPAAVRSRTAAAQAVPRGRGPA